MNNEVRTQLKDSLEFLKHLENVTDDPAKLEDIRKEIIAIHVQLVR